eukprot:tig00021073_g18041.t1
MLITEYRVPLPLEVPEYHVAQLYMVAKSSREESMAGKGDGIQVVKNEPYQRGEEQGQYTLKIFHIASKLPSWIRGILPKSVRVEEEAWNAYPYCKTVYKCPFLGNRFNMVVESMYLPDHGQTENALNLDKDTLKERTVEFVDIVHDPVEKHEYLEAEDPSKVRSAKTGRLPIAEKKWEEKRQPMMCCYKVCTTEFKMFGFQGKVEKTMQKVRASLAARQFSSGTTAR